MQSAGGNASKRVLDTTQGPWKRWRTRSLHGRAIRFIETYCRPSKGYGHGKPLKLAAFQKEFLEEALANDVGILQMPRGNGKSSLGGALAVWAVFDNDATGAPQVPIIATTITQAVRSCYGVAASMIRNEPELQSRSIPYTGIAQPRIVVPFNEGELFPISNDPEGLQGLDPSLAIVDEIGFQPIESWDSLRFAAGKRERSLTLGLGTPGTDTDVALFAIRKIAQEGKAPPGVIYHEHSAPEDADWTDPAVWRAANPALRAGFLRQQALAVDFEISTETQFRIFHLGQWVDSPPESWLGGDARSIWDGLVDPWPLEDGAPTWVGVDIALKRDTSAVVALQRREDGRLHANCRIWEPEADRPVDTTDIMQALRDMDARYSLEAISFDPRFFDVPAKYLEDEGLPMVEVPQSVERMTKAVGGAYQAIRKALISHDGDSTFTRHVLNAVPRFNERGFTLAKGKSRGHIDAAIALALAYDRVERQEEDPAVSFISLDPEPSDYEEEDW
jgi:phage terminase large subunit-like protein